VWHGEREISRVDTSGDSPTSRGSSVGKGIDSLRGGEIIDFLQTLLQELSRTRSRLWITTRKWSPEHRTGDHRGSTGLQWMILGVRSLDSGYRSISDAVRKPLG
jgi:hypothetical protein